MSWLRFEKGRKGSGYEKMLLLTSKFPLPFDIYLLRFKPGSYIEAHCDLVPKNFEHWRLNIFLKRAKKGGEFLIHGNDEGPIWCGLSGRIQLFRPDIQFHTVSKVEEGTRYVLSIGWLRNS